MPLPQATSKAALMKPAKDNPEIPDPAEVGRELFGQLD